MNIKSKITLALIALGVVSIASADNVVYLTGSTAFRSTVYTALHTPGNVFDGAVTQATRGGSLGGANYMLFHGNISGTPTYINCAWSGSEAGIASAAGVSIQNTDRNGNPIPLAGSPETWLKADGSVAMTDTTTSPTTAELETSSHQSDLAMADTSQAVSLTQYKVILTGKRELKRPDGFSVPIADVALGRIAAKDPEQVLSDSRFPRPVRAEKESLLRQVQLPSACVSLRYQKERLEGDFPAHA